MAEAAKMVNPALSTRKEYLAARKSGVKVIILRTAGTNCDLETKFAFEYVGAQVELVHINDLVKKKKYLKDYHILAIPGGFTYGDDIASGVILANELKYKLREQLEDFVKQGKLIIGICNGFQILVKAGILPGVSSGNKEVTLTINDSGKFEDRWIYLEKIKNECIWTQGIENIIYLPVAHGEGKFVAQNKDILKKLYENNQVVFKYVTQTGKNPSYPDNPNGSVDDIAGICDTTGRVFGLMPHPERHVLALHHPQWTRVGLRKEGDGVMIFRNGVEYAKKL
ncbi:MAG: phosphoribosylformylglycinamidine synthase I [Candidatus Omnitrophota bacterium]